MCVHREFSYESPRERILKIGPNLPKLLSNIKGVYFLGTQCNYHMVMVSPSGGPGTVVIFGSTP